MLKTSLDAFLSCWQVGYFNPEHNMVTVFELDEQVPLGALRLEQGLLVLHHRGKLGIAGGQIETVVGLGYRFVD